MCLIVIAASSCSYSSTSSLRVALNTFLLLSLSLLFIKKYFVPVDLFCFFLAFAVLLCVLVLRVRLCVCVCLLSAQLSLYNATTSATAR